MAGAFAKPNKGLDEPHKLPLRTGVAVDISFGRLDGSVAREKLNVAQAASGTVNVAGGDGDEAAPT